MKKFVLITVGFEMPSSEDMQKWMQWFQSIGDKMINQVGLMNGKEVKADGVIDLEMDASALTGFLTINAESMAEAVKIAQACPAITSTKVYEVRER